jgi:predicted phage terminase large subunit-like protein
VVDLCGAETLTTARIAQTLTCSARGDLNHCIPTTQPLNLPEADLPIDPWTLGYWLGNGCATDQAVTAGSYQGDFDVGHVVSMLGRECVVTSDHERGHDHVRIPGLRGQLKAAGLLGNKHIPAVYMRASVAQRLALLRGLCDSDGYASSHQVEFCSVDQVLAQDVHELVVSLGERATLTEGRATLNGQDFGPKYRVMWRWARFNPFSLPRKAAKMGPPGAQGFKHGHRMIVSVEPIEPKPMRCLTVDSPSRLYLAGRSMIPTHNTRTAAEQVGWWAWEQPGSRWLVAAPTSSDVRATCFEGDSGLMSVIPAALVAEYNKALHELRLTNGSLIKGIPASEPERFRGPQFHGAWCCIPGTLIATPGGERPIETLRAGDVVLTRHGPRRVLAAGLSGNLAALVKLDCGETSLTVTEDHPILVGDQWVAAGDVKEGASVWATSTSAAGTRTGSSTSGTTGRSRLAGWFITGTATLATTTLRTLRRCLGLSTTGCTRPASRPRTLRRLLLRRPWPSCALPRTGAAFSAAPGLFPWPLGGWVPSVLATAWSGGGATRSSPSSELVRSAEAHTSQRSGSSGTAAGRATTAPRCAPIAVSPLAVRRVERLPNAPTYNLTVEGEHEFIANGIVVHNCDELAAWDYIQEAWDQIQFGVRLGAKTRTVITTTPKPKDLIIELLGREGDDVVVTRASTYANLGNLSVNFKRQILQYEGTTLGRQEIHAEIIDPEEGGIVKRASFRLWPKDKPFPKFEYVLQSYDCATSEKTQNDPTASSTWGIFKPEDGPMSVMLIDCWQDRLQYPDLRPKVVEEYETVFESGENGRERKRVDLILIEDKSAGISLIQDLQRAHLPVRAYNPGKADKLQRLNIVSHIIARGRVWVPESQTRSGYVRDWAEPLISQICAFPQTTNDDLVDTTTQALRFLRDAGWLEVDPPPRDDWDDEDWADTGRPSRENPYAA